MRPTSKINSSLNKRRRLSLLKKVGYITIFVLFFLSLLVLGLTNDKIQIKSVSITGNISVPKEDILNIVNNNLDKKYLYIIRTDNFFLLKRWTIKREILRDMKKVRDVNISFSGLDAFEVSITERVGKYIWCDSTTTSKCYFMDEDGLVFTEAPEFSGHPFQEYSGLIMENPIGQSYFNNVRFKQIAQFFSALDNMKLEPKLFNAVDEHKYEVRLFSGSKIIVDDKKSFERNIQDLQAVIDNGYIKADTQSLKKIQYIDLTFGNKVIFK